MLSPTQGHPYDTGRPRFAFYSLLAVIYLTMEGSLGYYVIVWSHPTSVLLLGVLSVLFLGASYGMSREAISVLQKRKPSLPSLDVLPTRPRVALLYATMNDVVPECLLSMKQDYDSDVFVLDDSSDPDARATVDRISAEKGYTVVRREKRRGFKAGAINDWLRSHGATFDYILLFDADSYIPPDWVGQTLRYAEHPANDKVAVFQGLINIWNLDTDFAKTLAPMSKVGQFVWENGVANDLDAVYCYGHNAMVRVSALQEIGGFVEGYVSEDFATAVELASKGWHTRFVPLHTYEAVPENVRGFIKRQNKWTRGSMEFFAFAKKGRLTAGQKLNLLQVPLGHIINLLIPLGALLTVYGFASSSAGAFAFLSSLVANPAGVIWSVPILRFLLVLGLLTTVLSTIVRIRAGVTLMEELRHRVLSGAISAVMIPYELKSTLSYFLSGLRSVPVTPKSEKPLSWSEIIRISRFSLAFQGILWFGIFAYNPAGAVFNATWLVPMLLAPLILMIFNSRTSARVSDYDLAPVSSLVADSSLVNVQLMATAKRWREQQALVTPELESEAAPVPVAS